jgi:hypothetical protein
MARLRRKLPPSKALRLISPRASLLLLPVSRFLSKASKSPRKVSRLLKTASSLPPPPAPLLVTQLSNRHPTLLRVSASKVRLRLVMVARDRALARRDWQCASECWC